MPQVPFLKFLPVTINMGIWVFIWLWIGLQYNLVLWIPFISWAMWYMVGPALSLRKKRFHKNLIGALGGTFYAAAFIALIPVFSTIFGNFAIPVLGFLAGMTIVLLELTDWFEYAVAYFFTFAGYFAYAFGGFGPAGWVQGIAYYLALILAGFALGFITDSLRFYLLRAQGLTDESMQKTIFDKEIT